VATIGTLPVPVVVISNTV